MVWYRIIIMTKNNDDDKQYAFLDESETIPVALFFIKNISFFKLQLYGKHGTADFGELRHKNPILLCGLVA